MSESDSVSHKTVVTTSGTTVKSWGHSFNTGTGDGSKNWIINLILQLFCLCVGILLIGVGIARFFPVVQFSIGSNGSFTYNVLSVVVGIYEIIFGVIVSVCCIFFPKFVSMYLGFFRVYWGRGLFFIFLSALVLTNAVINIIFGIVLFICGIFLVIISFISSVPPPRPIIDCVLTD
jgi:hypothetical protein